MATQRAMQILTAQARRAGAVAVHPRGDGLEIEFESASRGFALVRVVDGRVSLADFWQAPGCDGADWARSFATALASIDRRAQALRASNPVATGYASLCDS